MAELNPSEIQLLQGVQFPVKEALKESTVDIPVTDILQCFVCDVKIQGRHYSLSTCRTQTTKNRVIEKLGELVGEKYVFQLFLTFIFFLVYICSIFLLLYL